MRPIAIDAFAGVGGMSLGFEQAGFDVVVAIERDPAHAAAHRFNFPRCEVVQADAGLLTESEVSDAVKRGLRLHGRSPSRRQDVDVLFGGPPCQGFSVGGQLDAADPRNRLVERFVRLVEETRPRAFVLENVPAMATRILPGCSHPVPDWLTRRLAKAGYDVRPADVLNASRHGVPQDRRRLLIVGALRGESLPILPEPAAAATPKRPGAQPRPGEVGHPSTPADLPHGPTVDEAIGDIPDLDSFEALLEADAVRMDDDQMLLSRALRSSYAAILAGDSRDANDLSAPRIWDPAVLTSSLRTQHEPRTVARFARTAPGEFEPTSRFYRLHRDGLSGTLRAGSASDRGSFSAPRPIHPTLDRVISVREAARLHGFPDWFRFTAAKWHGFRQVGNAVPPPLARAVAVSAREALDAPLVPADGPIDLGDPSLLLVASGAGRRPKRSAAVA